MASRLSDIDNEEIVDINVTPLVDVMLVLLVIFMVTASYIINQSINIVLPQATSGQELSSKNITIVIDKDSNIYLNGVNTDLANIGNVISKISTSFNNISILLAADRFTPHGSVIQVMDILRKLGIKDLAINVEAK